MEIMYTVTTVSGVRIPISPPHFAGVSELADETDSKSVVSNGVWVRVPPPAPQFGSVWIVDSGLKKLFEKN